MTSRDYAEKIYAIKPGFLWQKDKSAVDIVEYIIIQYEKAKLAKEVDNAV